MSAQNAYNFRRFTDSIDTCGVVGEENTEGLGGEQYVAVVNLLPEDSEYANTRERQTVEAQGLAYHYRPVDFAAPSTQDFQWYEATVNDLPQGKVLIHCAANYRVSAFSAIYAFRNLGWSAEQARRFVADVWDVSEHPVWERFLNDWLAG